MVTKRCGVNLGIEILHEAKQVFEVNYFWKKLRPINEVIKKAKRGEFQKNRIIIVEKEVADGLTSWLKRNKVEVLVNPACEEIRNWMISSYACFFLFTIDEFMKSQETEDFRRILDKLPKLLDLSRIGQETQLTQDEVMSAFSEVRDLPYCSRTIIEIKEGTLVNLVVLLILFKNYLQFCCEAMYCTEEKIQKCKAHWSKFSLRLTTEFYDLVRSEEIYYPLSAFMKQQFPLRNHCVDVNSFLDEFNNPLELAIFLHDAYHMGIAVYPGFGVPTDFKDRPDAYLLDYIYPLEKTIPLKQIASLMFLSILKKNGDQIKNFLENVTDKIKKLPMGTKVGELLSEYFAVINNCYELWRFNKEEVLLLYSIWKLKRILELSYQRTKVGLTKLNSLKAKAFLEKINSFLYGSKGFLEQDLALELGINLNLVKEFFHSINEIAKDENEVDALEQLLLLHHDMACNKLQTATVSYATRKIAASQIWENILPILKQMESTDSNEILELLPYVVTLFDYPIFRVEEKISFLQILQNKQCGQTKEITDFIKTAIMDEIVISPLLSIEIDKLVNQWETGNPLNFFKNRIREKIEQGQFDSGLFKKAFETFCLINTLNLFKREPSRFFDYQRMFDKYIILNIKKSRNEYFDYFQPITSVSDRIKKLQEENKKVILLIFDGLGFNHSYFACLEMSRQESKQLAEFSEYIISLFQKKKAQILSSHIPTLTGVNHIALFFGEKLLYDDSFLIRETDNSFMPDKDKGKAGVFSILKLNKQDRKLAIWRLRLEECNLQKPTGLWDKVIGHASKKGLLISKNSERTFLSYLLRGTATFKQVDSYTSAIDDALSDRTHDLVISQVNLMDTFLHALNTRYPPAFFDDIVKGYWEVYLDLWKNVVDRISKGFKKLKKGTVVIITADHGLALGRTSEFKGIAQILGSVKGVMCLPKHRIGELVSMDNRLIGACIPGHTSRKFMSVFLLKDGIGEKNKILEALELAKQANEVVFKEIKIEENRRNLTIKPDFLVFPTVGMFARRSKKKYYGGIHGGISMCELLIPLIQLER